MVRRKLWTDFGVELEMQEAALAAIRPKAAGAANPDDPRFSDCHWAFGSIRYPDQRRACLVYVKSSLTRDIPLDVRQYKDTHPTFPHESTADQWLDEDQFEAYRHLGQYVAERLLDTLLPEHGAGCTGPSLGAAGLVERLSRRACQSPAPTVEATAGKTDTT
jgi:hypothetical protein